MGSTIYTKSRFAWAGGAGSALDPANWQDLDAPSLTGTTAPDPNGGASTDFPGGGEVTDGLTVATLTVEGQATFDQGISVGKTTTVSGQLSLEVGGQLADLHNTGTLLAVANITFGGTLQNDGNIVSSGVVSFGNATNSGTVSGSGSFGATTLDNSGAINIGTLHVGTLLTAGSIATTADLSLDRSSGTVAVTIAGGSLDVGTAAAVEVLPGSNATGGIDGEGPVIMDAGAQANGLGASSTAEVASGALVTSFLNIGGKGYVTFSGTGSLSNASVFSGTLLVESGGSIDGGGLKTFSYLSVGGSSSQAMLNVEGGKIAAFGSVYLDNGSTINVDGAVAGLGGGEFDIGMSTNLSAAAVPYATFNVTNGATVSSGRVFIGYSFGRANSALIVSGGTWIASDRMDLHASQATATLLVENGGTVSTTGLSLLPQTGKLGKGSNTVTIDGAGSRLQVAGQLDVWPDTGAASADAMVLVQNQATLESINASVRAPGTVQVLNGGTWISTSNLDDSGSLITDGAVAIAPQSTVAVAGGIAIAAAEPARIQTPSMTVSGTAAVLNAPTVTIGGALATGTNSQGQPNGTGGNWSYKGADGRLAVSSSGSVTTGSTLVLRDIPIISGGSVSFKGGLTITSGGRVEVGGTLGAAANTLQIDNQAMLTGHGLIESQVVNHLPSGPYASAPVYSLQVINHGTIEAKQGLQVIHGNVLGDGHVLIANNSALELGGGFGSANAENGTIDFQGFNTGTLILDDPTDFHGTIANPKNGDDDPSLGTTIILQNTGTATNNAVVNATMGTLNGTLTLQIALGSDVLHPAAAPINIPIAPADDDMLSHDFFKVSQDGADTVLTLTKGNAIDVAASGEVARNNYGVNGSGVTVGVISDSFGTPSEFAEAIRIGALPASVNVIYDLGGRFGYGIKEGLAMAEVVHAIAPGATIDFYSNVALGTPDANLAKAIEGLRQAGAKIIVDDVTVSHEPAAGSLTERALDAAVQAGITYITSAGNRPNVQVIQGHQLDPHAIAVAAVNWLATAGSVGNYLPRQIEPFNVPAPASFPNKPDIYGPDGAQTTILLGENGPPHWLNPFFGTSAAAPAVAGVAALMMAKNHGLADPHGGPALLKSLLINSAPKNLGVPHGFVNADAAVAAAFANASKFYGDPPLPTLHVEQAQMSQTGGNASPGTTLLFYLQMSAGVTVSGGTPVLLLNDGAIASYAADVSDPGDANLAFRYTVKAGEATASLTITGVDLQGAVVRDIDGNDADFSNVFGARTGLSINSPLRAVSIAGSKTGEIAAGQTIGLTVLLNAGATIDATGGNPTLALSNGGTANLDPVASDLPAGKLVFDYVPQSGEATPDLTLFDLLIPARSSIRDSGGNNAEFSAVQGASLGVQVDPAFVTVLIPSQTGAIATGQTIELTLAMSQPVVVDTSAGTPTLLLNNGGSATLVSAASDQLTFRYTVLAGEQTPELQVVQVVPNGAIISDAYDVDANFDQAIGYPTGLTVNSPVTAMSVASAQTGLLQTGQTTQLTLTLNQPVQVAVLGTPALVLNDDGSAFYDATASTATSLVFNYTAQSGEATPNLTVLQANDDALAITDASGNRVDFSSVFQDALGLQVASVSRTLNWTGAVDTDFGNAANWNDLTNNADPAAAAPGSGDVAAFTAGGGEITAAGTTASVRFDGGGLWSVHATLTSLGEIHVGDTGVAELQVDQGGALIGVSGSVAAQASGDGSRITVSGTGSAVHVQNALIVGGAGSGYLAISASGVVSAATLDEGVLGGGSGIVSVIGAGSSLALTGSLTVGDAASAELSILNGATVSVADSTIGAQAGATGNVDLEGAGSKLILSGSLTIGGSGQAVLTLGTGTELTVTKGITVGPQGVVNNFGGTIDPETLTVVSGGTFSQRADGTGEYTVGVFNSGTISITNGTFTLITPMITEIDPSTDTGILQIQKNGQLVLNTPTVDAGQFVQFSDKTSGL